MPAPDCEEPDTYLITLPSLHIEGLIFGSPFVELDGNSLITSSTGFTAKIDYSGKGWLSGKKNSFTASLYPTGQEKFALYNVSGQWTKRFDVHSGPAKHNTKENLVDTWDHAEHRTSPLNVAPIEQQHPLESRRAWSKVAAGIAKGDMESVGKEKGKIEHAQREMRNREKAEGRAWERRYFSARDTAKVGPDPVLAELGSVVGLPESGDAERTGGLWRFDQAKADKVKNEQPLDEAAASEIAKELLGQ